MRAHGDKGRGRGSVRDGCRMSIALLARSGALGMNILLVTGGIVLAIWQLVGKANAVASYEAAGGDTGSMRSSGF